MCNIINVKSSCSNGGSNQASSLPGFEIVQRRFAAPLILPSVDDGNLNLLQARIDQVNQVVGRVFGIAEDQGAVLAGGRQVFQQTDQSYVFVASFDMEQLSMN